LPSAFVSSNQKLPQRHVPTYKKVETGGNTTKVKGVQKPSKSLLGKKDKNSKVEGNEGAKTDKLK